MLGIDTNLLVRYLVRDDEAQFEKANRLIKRGIGSGEAVFVSLPRLSRIPLGMVVWPLLVRVAAAVVIAALLLPYDVHYSKGSRALQMRPLSGRK